MVFSKAPLLIFSACSLLVAGCGSVSQAISNRKDASTAHNQMMLVRENPGTLGYRRLMAKSAESKDLKIFIEQTGLPDFLAEANSSNREYLIFYYLDKRQAFACRTATKRSGQVEFAGPYPMTANESRLLKAAKGKAAQVASDG